LILAHRQSSSKKKALERELQWLREGGQQRSNKARTKRFQELVDNVKNQTLHQQLQAGKLIIPPGPRLGDCVINVQNLTKSWDGRKVLDRVTFNLEPGAIMGIVYVLRRLPDIAVC
jgi:energy-dependent translational throttle protein EttA